MVTSPLFSPITFRGVTIKNRIMVAPMWQYCGVDWLPTDWHLMNLGRFAAGGAGLVFQEGTTVERRGCGTIGDLGLWDDRFVEPLRRIVDFVKACGAVPGIQLMHAGRKARQRFPWDGRGSLPRSPEIADWDDWDVIAPSAIPQDDGYPMPRAMTREDIDRCVEAWGSAAARADRAGYEVMELHAAHGYLIHEFLSPGANRRTDGYGGSFENRIRFAVEVVERVRASWPAHKPLFLRVSTEDDGGWEVEDSVRLARILKPLGVDAFDCSSGGITGASPIETRISLTYGYQVGFAERVRREADMPTVAVGLIIHADQADAILRDGQADMVAIARELLYNPNWPIDAAQKLGVDEAFALAPVQHGHFLHRRSLSGFTGSLSTWTAGMGAAGE